MQEEKARMELCLDASELLLGLLRLVDLIMAAEMLVQREPEKQSVRLCFLNRLR